MKACLFALALVVAWAAPALADDARPAALTIRERTPGTFDVRWQTPMLGGARLRVAPRLPDEAETIDGSLDRRVTGDALLETWRFRLPEGLEGRTIAIDGLAASRRGAIVTIELASGITHRAVLSGARVTFDVPEAVAAARTRWFEAAPGWVLEGARQGLGWVHVLLAVALVLAGGRRAWAFALGAFLVADIAGRLLPLELAPPLGLALVGLSAALASREALQGTQRRVVALGALAGLSIGLSTGAAQTLPETLSTALGLDVAHLVVGLLTLAVLHLVQDKARLVGYAVGVVAIALAVLSAVEAPALAETTKNEATLPMAMVGEGAAQPTRTTVDGIEVYVDVSVFQTRVEMQGRLPALVSWLGLEVPGDPVPVKAQAAFLQRVIDGARERFTLTIDDARAQLSFARGGFTRRDSIGVYLRDDAVPETVSDAVIGLVFKAETPGIPERVSLDVRDLPKDTPLRGRVLDPEVSQDVPFTADAARIEWTNALESDPLPPIEAVQVRTEAFVLPAVGLAVALLTLIGCLLIVRRRKEVAAAVLRLGLAAALVVMPLGALSLPSWGESLGELTEPEARAITGTLLDNIYRSFNERGEDEVYDRLALSLAGGELEKAYVENRAALALEEVGLTAHVDVVELRALKDVAPSEDGSFAAQASWTVAGSVTHFGHRHLRQNLYVARLVVRPHQGAWKIETLDVKQQERIR